MCVLPLWRINVLITRNVLCGTWYLPHSHVHNERTVLIIMAGCIAHAQNGRISTSGEKSDVNIVFHDPDLLKDAKIWAIQLPKRRENFGNSAINKCCIAYFSLRVREKAVFPLPVKNLTSTSCSSTGIS